MKTLNKIRTIGLSLMIIGMAFTGCKKETLTNDTASTTTSNTYGRVAPPFEKGVITVRLTNTFPSGTLPIANVEVVGVVVHYADPRIGYATIPVKGSIFDLYGPSVRAGIIIAEKPMMEAGRIDQIRLILGVNNTIIYGDQTGKHMLPLIIPGGENLVNLAIDARIENATNLTITLDFNATASINFEGNGTYLLNPVVRILPTRL